MSSFCYLVCDEITKRSIIVDPGSEKSMEEIAFINKEGLLLDYIFLTHEHIDHTWGVNSLLDVFPETKVICTRSCKDALPRVSKIFFQFYYDDPGYVYQVKRVDYITEELGWQLRWGKHKIRFISTPGHTPGSMCIAIDNVLFGGDTLMPFKPFIKKRNGGSLVQLQESIKKMVNIFPKDTIVYPGHGNFFSMGDCIVP